MVSESLYENIVGIFLVVDSHSLTEDAVVRKGYSTDIADAQWPMLEAMLPPSWSGRPRTNDLRVIVDAIRYVLRSGCTWRMLPHDLPPWPPVYCLCKLIVHPADIAGRDGACDLLEWMTDQVRWDRQPWADAGYRGEVVGWIKRGPGWSVEIVSRLADTVGFTVQHRRWVLERTFAWLGSYRRLAKDYESQVDTSEAWICAAMSHILLRRLAKV